MWKYNALLTGPQAVWQPLTDNEDWVTMEPGSLWLFHDGEVVSPHRFRGLIVMLNQFS